MRDIRSPLDGFASPLGAWRGFNPRTLFAASEQGQLMDANPIGLYTDTARTTLVSATGQSVAAWGDQSGRGNHDTQPTVGSRPIYGKHPANGYRNMLASSEDFSAAVWGKFNATVTANATVAPDGTTTADKLVEAVGVNRGRVTQTVTTAVGNTISTYAKAAEWNRVCIGISNGSGLWGVAIFNLSTGLVDGGVGYGGASVDTATITSVGNGWYRCSVRVASGTEAPVIMPFNQSGDPVNPSPALTGDGTSGIYIWGAQLGPTATTYQRTGASSGVAWPAPPSYDITEAGQPDLHYLHFNGVSSFMVSPTITPGIDKAQVFMGVRKLSDAAGASLLVEHSAALGSNNGTFALVAPLSVGTATFGFGSKGTAFTAWSVPSSGYAAPVSVVVSGIGDISGDVQTLRLNGSIANPRSDDQGTGNYLAYPIYTGRRAGTSLPFNGLVYSKIVRFGANLTADQITAAERWTGQRTGVSL